MQNLGQDPFTTSTISFNPPDNFLQQPLPQNKTWVDQPHTFFPPLFRLLCISPKPLQNFGIDPLGIFPQPIFPLPDGLVPPYGVRIRCSSEKSCDIDVDLSSLHVPGWIKVEQIPECDVEIQFLRIQHVQQWLEELTLIFETRVPET